MMLDLFARVGDMIPVAYLQGHRPTWTGDYWQGHLKPCRKKLAANFMIKDFFPSFSKKKMSGNIHVDL